MAQPIPKKLFAYTAACTVPWSKDSSCIAYTFVTVSESAHGIVAKINMHLSRGKDDFVTSDHKNYSLCTTRRLCVCIT